MNDLERSFAYKPTRSELAYVRRLPAGKLPRFSVIIPSLSGPGAYYRMLLAP